MINTDDKEPLRQRMNAKMEGDDSKELYKKRKVIVEPVFGQIKNSGFHGFSVRGKEKRAGEFSLLCATHNFKKLPDRLSGERSVRNSGNWPQTQPDGVEFWQWTPKAGFLMDK